jgi:hypothetical protein
MTVTGDTCNTMLPVRLPADAVVEGVVETGGMESARAEFEQSGLIACNGAVQCLLIAKTPCFCIAKPLLVWRQESENLRLSDAREGRMFASSLVSSSR